ncbi:MAG: hypothetical protein ACRD2J_07390 [Thermoanaerobaculia bacterium]
MKNLIHAAVAALAFPLIAFGQIATDSVNRQIARDVYEDVKVVRRVADVARRDMPRDVLEKILAEDLETLRGKTSEFQYRYARYERVEADRREERFTFDSKTEESSLESFTIEGDLVYRIRVQVPSRRMLLLSNHRVWVDRVDLRYTPIGVISPVSESVDVKTWLEPGDERMIEIPQVAREAAATLWVKTDAREKAAVDVAIFEASLVDDPNSPFATVVRRFQALGDAVEEREYRSVRNVADEILALLEAQAGTAGIRPVPPTILPEPAPRRATDDLYFELRHIEDLLRGSEAERAEGLQRLERLIERFRPQ